jgi:hypothetical protein
MLRVDKSQTDVVSEKPKPKPASVLLMPILVFGRWLSSGVVIIFLLCRAGAWLLFQPRKHQRNVSAGKIPVDDDF